MSKSRVAPLLITLGLIGSLLGGLLAPLSSSALTGSEFQAGRIIDNAKFFAASPMSVSDIQTFLNSKVPVCDTWGTQMHSSGQTRAQYSAANGVSTPFTCLRDYQTTMTAKAAETGLCSAIPSSGANAAEVIFWVGHSCGVNPQVLIVLLQKEQSLITDDWPWPIQYRSATGYGCPDTAPCDAEYYGFFNQVYNAARQFKRYGKDSHLFNFKAGMNANIQYNPSISCGSSTVFIQNQATAGLYNYTPYQPNQAALNNLYGTGDGCSAYGNRNFWRIFNDWFGSTFGPPDYSCGFSGQNVSGAGTGVSIMPNRPAWGSDKLSLVQLNNTGSACIEAHTWANSALQSWSQHVATNRPSITPTDARVVFADTNADGRDEMTSIEYLNTGSGKIEVHGWTSDFQHWASHTATNRGNIDPADAEVIAADTNGDLRDEFYLVEYQNTGSGKIEIHGWTSNFQQWVSHVATNRSSIDPGDRTNPLAEVIAADTNGDLVHEFKLVQYQNTGSGKIEVHGWNSNLQQWVSHIATSRGEY